jgi:hypothetical protein
MVLDPNIWNAVLGSARETSAYNSGTKVGNMILNKVDPIGQASSFVANKVNSNPLAMAQGAANSVGNQINQTANQNMMMAKLQNDPLGDALTKQSADAYWANQQRQQQMSALNQRASTYGDLNFKTMANPFAGNNQYLQGLNERAVGNSYGQMGNQLENLRGDLALRGITQDSGLAQSQNLQTRMAGAQQASQMLNQAQTDNYQKAADFDQSQQLRQQQFDQAKASALDSYDFNKLDRLRQLNNDQYEAGRQAPLDALKLRSGYQDYGHTGAMNPLLEQQQQLHNTGLGYENQYMGATLQPKIGYDNSQYAYGTAQNQGGLDQYNWEQKNLVPGMRSIQQVNQMTDQQAATQGFTNQLIKPSMDTLSAQIGLAKTVLSPFAGGMSAPGGGGGNGFGSAAAAGGGGYGGGMADRFSGFAAGMASRPQYGSMAYGGGRPYGGYAPNY